jgi:ribonuclease VapC
MVIDTSAVIAILQGEPERHRFLESLDEAAFRLMSVATHVETSMVVDARRGADGLRILDRFVERIGIELVPVDVDQGRAARDAFSRYGKGRHPARLNFGDCFSYALARTRDEPLLCKGDDFAHTDVALVR